MVFKDRCIFVLWTKVALTLEGCIILAKKNSKLDKRSTGVFCSFQWPPARVSHHSSKTIGTFLYIEFHKTIDWSLIKTKTKRSLTKISWFSKRAYCWVQISNLLITWQSTPLRASIWGGDMLMVAKGLSHCLGGTISRLPLQGNPLWPWRWLYVGGDWL